MTFAIIVIVLAILGVAVVAWTVRKKPAETRVGPREADTAWNDPVARADAPGATAYPTEDVVETTRTSTEPRP